jgi:hypothetical protein
MGGYRVHRPPILPRRAHHRPLYPIDLEPKQEYRELPLHPLLLTDPKSHSGHPSSAPPTTASPPSSSSPSVGHLGELLSTQSVSIGSKGSELAPLAPPSLTTHRRSAGIVGEPSLGEGEWESPVFGSGPKVLSGLGRNGAPL